MADTALSKIESHINADLIMLVHQLNRDDPFVIGMIPFHWAAVHQLSRGSDEEEYSEELCSEQLFGIVGMGGLGKTSLPHHLHNSAASQEAVEKDPNKIAWLNQRVGSQSRIPFHGADVHQLIWGSDEEEYSDCKEDGRVEYEIHNGRNTLAIVAGLAVFLTFQAARVGYTGTSVLARTMAHDIFMASNIAAFFISIGIVTVLETWTKLTARIIKFCQISMWAVICLMSISFISASWATVPSYLPTSAETKWIKAVLVVGAGATLGAVFTGVKYTLIEEVKWCTRLKAKSLFPQRDAIEG